MSHTLSIGRDTTFHYNGDYSGKIEIVVKEGGSVKVQMEVLIGFIAEYVRYEKIQKLESMNSRKILGLD